MSDEAAPAQPESGPLGQAVSDVLAPLGGRTAVAAQRFGPLPAPGAAHTSGSNGASAGQNGGPGGGPGGGPETSVAMRADEVFPAASLIKVGIAVELLRRVDLGQFDLGERIDTSDEPRVGGAGVLDVLDPTTRLTLGELCALMLVVSDNTAANSVLDLVGMGEVNETMRRLNFTHTTMARRFMDAEARAAGRENTTSAGDMLGLMGLIRGGALPGGRRLRAWLAAQQSFSELIEGWLPNGATLAHKDGTLEGVVHDSGILSGPGGVAMYCILTAEQEDVPAARAAIGRTLRLLWDEWRLG